MGPSIRHRAVFLSILLLWPIASAASVNAGPRLPRFELRAAVATTARVLPAAEDLSDLRKLLDRDAMPRSLAAVDLDGDGMPELAAGFALPGGAGLVAHWRGNPDALFPWSDEAREHRADETFTDAPFLGPPSVLFVPEAADLLAAGDVDGDGRGDLLAVARGGSTVYRFRGDGAGGLGAAPPLVLPGTVTAWAVERPGASPRVRGLAIAVDGTEGPRVLRFTGPGGVLTHAPETVPLPAPASELLFGAFGDDGRPGLAVVTDGPLVLIHGEDGPPELATRSTIDLDAARLGAFHVLRQGTPVPPSVLGNLPGVAELPDPVDVAAVLPLRLNADAVNDLVILETGRSEPRVVATVAGSTFTVDSTGDEGDFDSADNVCDTDDSADDGPCTLRAALEQANATASVTVIDFAIPQAGPWVIHTITPQTPLPELTFGSITLDASSQAVQVVGSDLPSGTDGLVLSGPDNVVRSLRIHSFQGNGIEVGSTDNVIEGCQIGRVFGIQSDVGNVRGIDVPSVGNTIGGALDAARNVISGNAKAGVVLRADAGGHNVVQNNFIGTDNSGRNAILGTTGQWSQERGIWLAAGHHELLDNLIGANAVGISVTGGSFVSTTPTQILGSSIGTDVDGTSALANGVGIDIAPLVGEIRIGSPTLSDRNLVSGNFGSGIRAVGGLGDTPELMIHNNYIGTDVTGTVALPNLRGIELDSAGSYVGIGTLTETAGAGNLISGNLGHGVLLSDSLGMGTEHDVGLNLIGTDATGAGDLGNGGFGISIIGPAGYAEIGPLSQVKFPTVDKSNWIAFNGQGGIHLGSGSHLVSIGHNRIFANDGLGIDLYPVDGVTLNDPFDGDTGGNDLQNFPVIENLVSDAGRTSLIATVTLRSTPSTPFKVLLYESPTCDPSGFGEGRTYLDTVDVTTNASGYVSTDVTLSSGVPTGHYVTATATDMTAPPAGLDTYQTSEFSMCRREDPACPYPPDLIIPYGLFPAAATLSACQTITTTGEVVVGAYSNFELRAGRSIALGSGFKVIGSFKAVIDPSLDVP